MGGAAAAGFAEAREPASRAEPPGLLQYICGLGPLGDDGGGARGDAVFAAQGSIVPRQAQPSSRLCQLAARERPLREGRGFAARRRASRLAACGARGSTGGIGGDRTGAVLRSGRSGRRAVAGLGRVITLAVGSVGAAGGPTAREAAALAGCARLGGCNPQATGHRALSRATAGGGAAGGARVARAHAGSGVGGVGGAPWPARGSAAAARGVAVARGLKTQRVARPCAAMGSRRLLW